MIAREIEDSAGEMTIGWRGEVAARPPLVTRAYGIASPTTMVPGLGGACARLYDCATIDASRWAGLDNLELWTSLPRMMTGVKR